MIHFITALVILNIYMLLIVLKKINLISKSFIFPLVFTSLMLKDFNALNIIAIVTVWVGVFLFEKYRAHFSYSIINISEDNFEDLGDILRAHTIVNSQVEVTKQFSEVSITGRKDTVDNYKQLKKDMNNYIMKHGKVSLANKLMLLLVFVFTNIMLFVALN